MTELAAALGPAKALWDQLVAGLADEYDVDIEEWRSYSRKMGWSLRLKRKKRTIVWLSPLGVFESSVGRFVIDIRPSFQKLKGLNSKRSGLFHL